MVITLYLLLLANKIDPYMIVYKIAKAEFRLGTKYNESIVYNNYLRKGIVHNALRKNESSP